ncbi:plasmid mobilization protein [Burkholderia gladioli]|uniref:plasmid mobilization protein n=1 Tax=Burkholderia gladioli TaxID=28095 RepID=UPI00163EAE4B|nr:plasmid mobilization relaxosome protein MobC [Burkholderia gladioli]
MTNDEKESPPKNKGRPRSKNALGDPISTRLNESQMAVFREKVRRSGMKPAEFLRECVLNNRTQVVVRAPATADRKRIMFVVNKAGNNLNQLAHIANSMNVAGRLSQSTFDAILSELEMLNQLLIAHLRRVD